MLINHPLKHVATEALLFVSATWVDPTLLLSYYMHSCHVALRVGKDDVYFVSKAATGGFEDKDLCNNSVRIEKRDGVREET